jgi:hypothetical protein
LWIGFVPILGGVANEVGLFAGDASAAGNPLVVVRFQLKLN